MEVRVTVTDSLPVRMIVTDLDGTLLDRNRKIPEGNARALRRAAANGLEVAFASGRLPGVCSRLALDIGLPECRIMGMNGALIWDRPFGERLAETTFLPDAAEAVVRILDAEGCIYNAYTPDGVFTNLRVDAAGAERFRAGYAGANVHVVIGDDAGMAELSEQVVKFLVKDTGGPEGFRRAQERIRELPGIYLTSSGRDNFEVMRTGIGKAEAIRFLAGRLGIPLSAVMPFGDYDNDVEMLTACGHAVAMGNGSPSAKAAARYITLENTADGVGYAVDALLDGKLEALRKGVVAQPLRSNG